MLAQAVQPEVVVSETLQAHHLLGPQTATSLRRPEASSAATRLRDTGDVTFHPVASPLPSPNIHDDVPLEWVNLLLLECLVCGFQISSHCGAQLLDVLLVSFVQELVKRRWLGRRRPAKWLHLSRPLDADDVDSGSILRHASMVQAVEDFESNVVVVALLQLRKNFAPAGLGQCDCEGL